MRFAILPIASLLLALPACEQATPAARPAVAKSGAAAPAAVAVAAPVAARSSAPAALTAPPGTDRPLACNHEENPACATAIDPKVAAKHGPEVALAGTRYGAGVTLPASIQVSELMANPDKWVGQRVRVEGEVEDVCRMRGCWFALKSDKAGQTLKFKVTDGLMTFPVSAIGKHAVAEGQVRKMPLDLEQTRKVLAHEAQEQGKPFDPASVQEPMTLVRLDGLGAVIADDK